ncbi:hypothetical protein GPECTOR_171g196 [Gonium pectorale]|uniref:Uncharacterized protein n=1 Tax=Gonium pectorale TaxID=33097 RepID=A0A150FYY8_GONPE|nr:hypothetical protein GPECTOR_171g196 [Gonium pectorale]|eukprot:KXZ42270.1 hypothetical protein GPECTOR_171g196 [Gonium pectorale]
MMVSNSVDELRASTREAVCSRMVSHPCVVQCYAINITRMTEQDLEPGASLGMTPAGTRNGLFSSPRATDRDILAGPCCGPSTSPTLAPSPLGSYLPAALNTPVLAGAVQLPAALAVPPPPGATMVAALAGGDRSAHGARGGAGRGRQVDGGQRSRAQSAVHSSVAAAAAACVQPRGSEAAGGAAAGRACTAPPAAGGPDGNGGDDVLRGAAPVCISEEHIRKAERCSSAAAGGGVAAEPMSVSLVAGRGLAGSGGGGGAANGTATGAAATASPSGTVVNEGYGSSIVWWADGTESVQMELDPSERSAALRAELLRLGAAPGKFLTTIIMEW